MLPGVWETKSDQTVAPSDLVTGEPVVKVL
jgi:hypothetical protein